MVVYLLEHYFLGTHYLATLLGQRLAGYASAAFHVNSNPDIDDITRSVLRLVDVPGFFSSPQTWIGLAVGVALIVGTIQVRMRRSEV
jgi:hypothetical protein